MKIFSHFGTIRHTQKIKQLFNNLNNSKLNFMNN